MTPPSGPADVAYRARALAQAHPLTAQAKRYRERTVDQQGAEQPLPEIGIWAGQALLHGYCVRRVEEIDAGVHPDDAVTAAPADLEEVATAVAADLRSGDGARFLLGDEQCTVDTLDRIIATEVERRLDHWRDEVDESAWAELEVYLAWWVVKCYALRVAETTAP
ncbi:hypothetical protein BH20ACT2_BH20ACT2_00850 [soil metagenome]